MPNLGDVLSKPLYSYVPHTGHRRRYIKRITGGGYGGLGAKPPVAGQFL